MKVTHSSSAAVIVLLLATLTAQSEARTIRFAGCEWSVRSAPGGPGPNVWSDSPESVWVDEDGLHLRIRNVGDQWYCAEVTTVKPTRYGMHRFYVTGPVDRFDKNVVASPFLYKSDTQEIDVEFSAWGKSGPDADNAQFVVQPYNHEGNRRTFNFTLTGDSSTHSYDWSSEGIHFLSIKGHSNRPQGAQSIIQEWAYTGDDNPKESDNLHVHINLWLFQGKPPSDGKEVEFVIRNADLPISQTNNH